MQALIDQTRERIERVKELEELTSGPLWVPSAQGLLREWPQNNQGEDV